MMKRATRSLSRTVGVIASAAVIAGGLTVTAAPSQAAVGDITAYGTPLTAQSVTTIGSNAWVLSSDIASNSSRLTRIAADGAQVTLTINGFAQNLTAGPDGNVWIAGRGAKAIYRVDANLGVTTFTSGLPANPDVFDITSGPDGALWFTLLGTKAIGRISTDGAISTFSAGNLNPRQITAGPDGSNALYFGVNDNVLGRISTAGQVSTISAQNGTFTTDDPVVAGTALWFIENGGANGVDNLARAVNDRSSVAIVTRNISKFDGTTQGLGDSFWVASTSGQLIAQFSKEGAQLQQFPVIQGPTSIHQSLEDGSMWMTAGAQALKINVGVVPVTSKAPVITPATGIVAGTTLTTDNGEWNYAPGATYTYRWQPCASSDPSTCGDTPNNTAQTFVVPAALIGKYIRSCVLATNSNGPATAAACSAPLALGSTAPPAPPAPPAPATGPTASIGNGATMAIDAPTQQKRGKRATYTVSLTVTDAQGTVQYVFKKKKKTKRVSVPVTNGLASYTWKAPKKWKTGKTTVTATFTPINGSAYSAGQVKDTVRIK